MRQGYLWCPRNTTPHSLMGAQHLVLEQIVHAAPFGMTFLGSSNMSQARYAQTTNEENVIEASQWEMRHKECNKRMDMGCDCGSPSTQHCVVVGQDQGDPSG